MANLVLIVNVKIAPGYADRLKSAMLENAANSVREDGCLQFDIVYSRDDANDFIFYEVYKDEDALASHRQTPHYLKYFALMQELGDKAVRKAQMYTKMN